MSGPQVGEIVDRDEIVNALLTEGLIQTGHMHIVHMFDPKLQHGMVVFRQFLNVSVR